MLRFYWWPDGDIHKDPVPFRMLVHLFGATSSPACATFALNQIALNDDDGENAKSVISKNFYVDDCLVSVNDESKAVKLVEDLTEMCAKGGFKITKWISNSCGVINMIPQSERSKDINNFDLECDELLGERVLGVYWPTDRDAFELKTIVKNVAPSKRNILSVIAFVHDPLGMASPFVLTAKFLLQEMCRMSIGWDNELPENIVKVWQK